MKKISDAIGGWVSMPTINFTEQCEQQEDGSLASGTNGNILTVSQECTWAVMFGMVDDHWTFLRGDIAKFQSKIKGVL